MKENGNSRQLAPQDQMLPANLPAGAKAFQAAVDGMLTQDVWREILNAQVAKAKEGDRGAAKFLLEYAGGVMSMRGATYVQNNYYDAPAASRPDTPITPEDDGENRLRKLEARARTHMPITGQPGDGRVRPVSDEEEKEFRRRQQAEEAEAEGDPLRD